MRFTHPLLGSAVVARQTPARHRSLHARLADVVPSAEERARHLALADSRAESARSPRSSRRRRETAHARGAPAAAAELAEEALRLTPAWRADDARRRMLDRSRSAHRAGDTTASDRLSSKQARAAARRGTERATVWHIWPASRSSPQPAVALYREALPRLRTTMPCEATIHLRLAGLLALERRGIERGIEHAELAVHAASRVDDAALRCRALAAYGRMHFNSGRGIRTARWRRRSRSNGRWPQWPLDERSDLGRTVTSSSGRRSSTARGAPSEESAGSSRHGTILRRGRNALVAEPSSSGGQGTGSRPTGHAIESLDLRTQFGRSGCRRSRDARRDDRSAPGPNRARRALGRSAHSHARRRRRFALRSRATLGPRLRRALARRRRRGARVPRDAHRRSAHAFMLEPGQRLELGDLAGGADHRRRARRGREDLTTVGGARRGSRPGLGTCDPCPLPRTAARRAGRSRGRLRELRAGALRARSQHGSVPPRADVARPRQDATPCEEARRRTHDARGRARALRAARRAALGRAERAPSWRASAGVRPRTTS